MQIINKHSGLAREMKKLWNMGVTIIQIVVGSFERSPNA